MNILPKKRWHVRTKDNIAKVRRDEAAAKEEERKRLAKQELADSEARINFLRSKSGLPERCSTDAERTTAEPTGQDDTNNRRPFDLFADYESHIKNTNKELEKEQKEEKEKYEKKIGYLTYLGQDTNEALKLRSWYEIAPKRCEVGDNEVETDLKNKFTHDPLTLINALLPPEKRTTNSLEKKEAKSVSYLKPQSISLLPLKRKSEEKQKETSHRVKKSKKDKKHKDKKRKKERRKKRKHSKHDIQEKEDALQRKKDMLDKLRKERLEREEKERIRQDKLLKTSKADGPEREEQNKNAPSTRIVQKYNSQFNPEFAKQNMV